MTVAAILPHVEQTRLRLADGNELHVEHHAAAGRPLGTLVMVHGFATHCGRYREVSAAFAGAGLSVYAFDCRGHGLSTGRRGYVERFTQFLDDLHAVVEQAREADGGLPIVVVGHSHGGTIALAYALETRSSLAELVLAAPWLDLKMTVPAWKRALSGMMGRVWPALTMGNELREQDTMRDPATRARLAGDALVHHVATPRWFNEVRATQAYIRQHATALRTPTFMALAGDDRIVSTDAALAFARQAGPVVEVKLYDNAFHELFLEPDWARIVEDCASWVVARLSAPYNSKTA